MPGLARGVPMPRLAGRGHSTVQNARARLRDGAECSSNLDGHEPEGAVHCARRSVGNSAVRFTTELKSVSTLDAAGRAWHPLANRLMAEWTAARDVEDASDDAVWLSESSNPQMTNAIATARSASACDLPVLITGESGTGKRTMARAIHAWTAHRGGPFVTVWCGGLAAHPLERPLIDHLQGACTGMGATMHGRPDVLGNGTLFFDEIGHGNLPGALQVKLLDHFDALRFGSGAGRRDIAARIISATQSDLVGDIRAGRLRADLFYHLSVLTIALPPLRERLEDLPRLADHLLLQLAAHHRRDAVRLDPAAHHLLARQPWPGNLRELAGVLERAVVLARGDCIGAEEVAASLCAPVTPALSLIDIEQRQIELALHESTTLAEAAARLGINPATLWRKRKRYGLDRLGRSPARLLDAKHD